MTELTRLTAVEMARRVRAGELDPVELVDAHLERIRSLDGRLHAFVAVLEQRARAEAAALHARSDLAQLPLAGVPVAVKDNVDVAGEPTTHGSQATPRTPATHDDLLVRRLNNAGAVVVGRTVMPELAIWPFTEPVAYPAPRNPWNLSRTPGGSSGGSAVAVASGMAALAIASDGGGSIRIPAACCGIVGAKPAPGLVPLAGGQKDHWRGLSVFGSLARTVEDAALMLDVMSARSDARVLAPPGRLRITVSRRHPTLGARASTEVCDALRATAAALSEAGHMVEHADPPYPSTPVQFMTRWLAGITDDAESLDPALLEPRTRGIVRTGRLLGGRARPAADSRFATRMAQWLRHRDLLVTPVLSRPAVPIGTWRGGWVATTYGIAQWMGYTPPWNLACLAGVAIPCGMSAEGLPIGMQLVGPAGSEPTLLSVAAQLERMRPWPAVPEMRGVTHWA